MYLREERSDDGTGDFILSLQRHNDIDSGSGTDPVLALDLVAQLNVRVTVTEPRDVCHLRITQLQQLDAVFVVQLHHVKHCLHTLSTDTTLIKSDSSKSGILGKGGGRKINLR